MSRATILLKVVDEKFYTIHTYSSKRILELKKEGYRVIVSVSGFNLHFHHKSNEVNNNEEN